MKGGTEVSPAVVAIVVVVVVLIAGVFIWRGTGKKAGTQVDSKTMIEAMQKAGMRSPGQSGTGGPGGAGGPGGPAAQPMPGSR